MKPIGICLSVVVLLLISPALGSHLPPDSGWAEEFYDDEGNLLYCNALDTIEVGAGLYLHDRKGDEQQSGMTDTNGGGTWIYQEANDIPGLQVGGTSPTGQSGIPGVIILDDEEYAHCPNADQLIF